MMKLSLAVKQCRIKVGYDDSEVLDIKNDPGIKIKSSPNMSPADMVLISMNLKFHNLKLIQR